MKSQRVLFLQHSSLLDGAGGIEYYLDDLVHMAAEISGPENVCTVLATRTDRTPELPGKISVVKLSHKLENRLALRLFLRAKSLCQTFRPDILVCSHVALTPWAWLLSKATKIPYVTCVYGIDAWGRLGWPYENALRASDGILSISQWTKNQLVQKGYDENAISLVYPHLPTEFEFSEIPERSTSEELRLLTVSRLSSSEQYKGQDHVLSALAELRKSHLSLRLRYCICGEGDDKPRLQKLVQDLGLQSTVEFRPGVQKRSEFADLYRETDLYIMPSRFGYWGGRWRGEGFGIVYLEAAAFGIPSIAYDCGGVTDIVVSGETGVLVPSDDLTALARAISELAESPQRRLEMGRRAFARTMQRFTRKTSRHQLKLALQEKALRKSDHVPMPLTRSWNTDVD